MIKTKFYQRNFSRKKTYKKINFEGLELNTE